MASLSIKRPTITDSLLLDLVLSYCLAVIVSSMLFWHWKYAGGAAQPTPPGMSASDYASAIGMGLGLLYIYSQIPAYIFLVFPWAIVLYFGIKQKRETLLYYTSAGALVIFTINVYIWALLPNQPFVSGLPPPFWSGVLHAIRYQTFMFLAMGASFGATTFCVLALCQKMRFSNR
jgi:hypothetical protein